MSTIDPTKRAAVSWHDWDGPHSSSTRLTVAWLDEDNREMAQDIRGMHAYWMAQAFKARDAEIKQRGECIDALSRDLDALRLERDRAVELLREWYELGGLETPGRLVIDTARVLRAITQEPPK